MSEAKSRKALNLLEQIEQLAEREDRINRALAGVENYTATTNLRDLSQRLNLMSVAQLENANDALISTREWPILLSQFDLATVRIESAAIGRNSRRKIEMGHHALIAI